MVIIRFRNERMFFICPLRAKGRDGYDENCILQYKTL